MCSFVNAANRQFIKYGLPHDGMLLCTCSTYYSMYLLSKFHCSESEAERSFSSVQFVYKYAVKKYFCLVSMYYLEAPHNILSEYA